MLTRKNHIDPPPHSDQHQAHVAGHAAKRGMRVCAQEHSGQVQAEAQDAEDPETVAELASGLLDDVLERVDTSLDHARALLRAQPKQVAGAAAPAEAAAAAVAGGCCCAVLRLLAWNAAVAIHPCGPIKPFRCRSAAMQCQPLGSLTLHMRELQLSSMQAQPAGTACKGPPQAARRR